MRYNGFSNDNIFSFNVKKVVFLHWTELKKLKPYKIIASEASEETKPPGLRGSSFSYHMESQMNALKSL